MNQPTPSMPSPLHQALMLHHQGRLAEAKMLYLQLLQAQPQHFDALHLLGLVELQNDQPAAACDLISRALMLKPNDAEAHYNLGVARTANQQAELAIKSYRQAIRFDAQHVKAHYNRANLLRELGRLEDAVAAYRQVLELEPKHLEAHYNCAVTLQALQQMDAALLAFEQAIDINANLAAAHFNRGLILQERGQDATASFEHAIRLHPPYAQTLSDLLSLNASLRVQLEEALVLHQQGQLAAAETIYRQVLQAQPRNADALHCLGLIMLDHKQAQVAVDLISRALTIKPNDAEMLYHLGLAHQANQHDQQAIDCYQQALARHPNPASVYNSLGIALHNQCQFEAALDSFTRAIQIDADCAQFYSNCGNTLIVLKQFEKALAYYDHAIRLQPHYADAYVNRGIALQRLHRFDEVLPCYEQAISLDAHHVAAHWNKSLALLASSHFKEGWPLYEWRLQADDFTPRKLFTNKPHWKSGAKKRTLVWSSQGLGDDLMFSMLLNEFNKKCQKLIVKVDARIIPLLQRSLPSEITLVAKEDKVDESLYDAHLPLESLCQYLRKNEKSFKLTTNGYIKDDKTRTHNIKQELKNRCAPNKKLCGISWRSTNKQESYNRSIALSEFIQFIKSADYEYISLQYGTTPEEIEHAKKITDIQVIQCQSVNNYRDIDGLASLIQACDIVISVDNSTVHLAGALGQDVRILLPFAADWRWQLGRSDSLWYASAKLYRQDKSMNWGSVFEQLKADLSHL